MKFSEALEMAIGKDKIKIRRSQWDVCRFICFQNTDEYLGELE